LLVTNADFAKAISEGSADSGAVDPKNGAFSGAAGNLNSKPHLLAKKRRMSDRIWQFSFDEID